MKKSFVESLMEDMLAEAVEGHRERMTEADSDLLTVSKSIANEIQQSLGVLNRIAGDCKKLEVTLADLRSMMLRAKVHPLRLPKEYRDSGAFAAKFESRVKDLVSSIEKAIEDAEDLAADVDVAIGFPGR